MSKQNILFIINPISGGKDKLKIPALIDTVLDKSRFSPNFSFTEYVGHAAEIAEEASGRNFDLLVAVGGDGTVNEVAGQAMRYGKTLGIIPFGSGNGLARFLRIPMNTVKAIRLLNTGSPMAIDTGTFNGKAFFNMSGMGFDAHIAAIFAGRKSRGLAGYLKSGVKEVLNYHAQRYQLEIDGVVLERRAFVISIANSSQYGNNVHVSPEASARDGLMDVCIIGKFPMYRLPALAYRMVRGLTHRSDMVEIIRGKHIRIRREQEGAIHIDGEPFYMGREIVIDTLPLSLDIIVPGV